MSSSIRIPSVLISLSAALGAWGCGPLVVPVPPPVPTATSMTAPGPGELALDAGVSGLVSLRELEASVNIISGTFPVSLSYGLNERVQLSATWGFYSLLRTGGLDVGVNLYEGERSRLGLSLGLGASGRDGSYSVDEPVLDDDGNPTNDEQGNQLFTSVLVNYAYFGLAPAVGGRGELDLAPWLKGVAMLRTSYAMTFELYGLDDQNMPRTLFLETGVGLVARPVKGLEVGLGVVELFNVPVQEVATLPSLSVGYTFPVR